MKQGFDWSRATIVAPEDMHRFDGGVEMLYRMGETTFAEAAPDLVARGWSVIPQERQGRRGPGRCGGVPIAWKPYQIRLPSDAEIASWALENPSHNVAIITGPASSNLFGLDIDCDDVRISGQVRRLALEMLGPTKFLRTGRAPRSALFYRSPEGDKLAKIAHRFEAQDVSGKVVADERNGFEILANGSPITAYGKHHRTGKYFQWHGTHEPLYSHVTDVPICPSERVAEFIRAVHAMRPLYRMRAGASSGAGMHPQQGAQIFSEENIGLTLYLPRLGDSVDGRWLAKDEVVYEGREAFLYAACTLFVRHNEAHVRAGLVEAMVRRAQSWLRHFVVLGDKFERGESWFERDVAEKVRRFSREHLEGGWFARPVEGVSGKLEVPVARIIPTERPKDGSLDWIGTGDIASGVTGKRTASRTTEPVKIEGAKESRALLADRTEVSARVSDSISAAIGGFLADVDGDIGRVHVVPAGTGVGKTSRVIPRLVEYLRAHPDAEGEVRPILFVAPNHANLAEARAIAEAAGASFEGDDSAVPGMIFQSKLRAGCDREDEVRRAQEHHLGTSGFCRARIPAKDDEDEATWLTCEFFDLCGHQRQLARAKVARLILLPRAYLTSSALPKALKNPIAVVLDETVVGELLAIRKMPLGTLKEPRAETQLTDRERAEGTTAGHLATDREKAAEIATKAILARRDVAAAFVEHPHGERYLSAARRVCASAMTASHEITPAISTIKLEDLCFKALGSDLATETRFWNVVRERYDNLLLDRNSPLFAHGVRRTRAKGAVDPRIQWLRQPNRKTKKLDDLIRVAWRPRANWQGRPTMLLDASADIQIAEHLFCAEIVTTPLEVPLDLRIVAAVDRTYSPSSFSLRAGASPDAIGAAAAQLVGTRDVIALTAGAHAYGRTLVVASRSTRKLLFNDWKAPLNVDEAHLGALRGLDVFKNHVAVIVVGRTEQPVWVVDGLVAALTYDMDEPEGPHDRLGTGVDANGRPVLRVPTPRTLSLRSGHDTSVVVMEMPGRWARKLDAQWRDEETRQAIGRLRPIHASAERWETPTAIILSSCVPPGLVVDEVTSMDDLLASPGAWVGDALRQARGVLCPRITPRLSHYTSERIAAFVAEPADRLRWGLTPVDWTDTTGVTTRAYVSTHVEDPEGAILEAIAAADMDGEACVASVVPDAPVRPRVAATERAPDAVSAAYLTEAQRSEREALFEESLAEMGETHEPRAILRARFEVMMEATS